MDRLHDSQILDNIRIHSTTDTFSEFKRIFDKCRTHLAYQFEEIWRKLAAALNELKLIRNFHIRSNLDRIGPIKPNSVIGLLLFAIDVQILIRNDLVTTSKTNYYLNNFWLTLKHFKGTGFIVIGFYNHSQRWQRFGNKTIGVW